MYRILLALPLLVLPLSSLSASLCIAKEVTVFSCQLTRTEKIVSLCALTSANKGETKAKSLRYRFGKIGSPEFQFPTSPDNSLSKFRFSHYFRSQFDSTNVSFRSASFIYDVFDTIDGEASEGEAQRTAGVSVASVNNKKGATLNCKPRSVIANWWLINGTIPCDEETGFPNSCEFEP